MSYSGLEIQLKEFSKSLRGYDTNEVRYFLEEVAKVVESLSYEVKILKDKIRDKELIILDFKERESMLKDTILTARKITESIKTDANKEADLIIKEANVRAEILLKDARYTLRRNVTEIQKLKKIKIELVAKLNSTLDTHKAILKDFNADEDLPVLVNAKENTISI